MDELMNTSLKSVTNDYGLFLNRQNHLSYSWPLNRPTHDLARVVSAHCSSSIVMGERPVVVH